MAIHKTLAQWAESDLVMKNGESWVESDTGRVKIGDGARVWADLPYFASGIGFLRDIMPHRHLAEDFVDLGAGVRAASLTGLSTSDASSVTSADSVLSAIGKLQARSTLAAPDLTGLSTSDASSVTPADSIVSGIGKLQARTALALSGLSSLTDLSTADSSSVTASDSVLSAIGKLQARSTLVPTSLSGLSTSDASPVTSADSILSALGKLQARSAVALSGGLGLLEGSMSGGRLSVAVSSGTLTLSLRTLSGTDPSPSDPVRVRIAGIERTVSSALSVSAAAGTSWCAAGSSEVAAQEIDYFAYLGYNTTDGVTIGFSRIPYGRAYSDFATPATSARRLVTSSASATASDAYRVVGGFTARLSAGSSYSWSLPTDTRLVHTPISSTRWLSFAPVASAAGSMTVGSVGYEIARYRIDGPTMYVDVRVSMTTSGTGSNTIYLTHPMPAASTMEDAQVNIVRLYDSATNMLGYCIDTGTAGQYGVMRGDSATFGIGAARYVYAKGALMLA